MADRFAGIGVSRPEPTMYGIIYRGWPDPGWSGGQPRWDHRFAHVFQVSLHCVTAGADIGNHFDLRQRWRPQFRALCRLGQFGRHPGPVWRRTREEQSHTGKLHQLRGQVARQRHYRRPAGQFDWAGETAGTPAALYRFWLLFRRAGITAFDLTNEEGLHSRLWAAYLDVCSLSRKMAARPSASFSKAKGVTGLFR